MVQILTYKYYFYIMGASMSSSYTDPPDRIEPIAMIVLFGSIMFATVSLMARMLLLGDRRAISTATTISLKSPFAENVNSCDTLYTSSYACRDGDGSHPGVESNFGESVNTYLTKNDESHDASLQIPSSNDDRDQDEIPHQAHDTSRHRRSMSSSGSVGHNRTILDTKDGNTVANIRLRESAFVSTFVFLYHMTILGVVLLLVYLIDKYPPNGRSSSLSPRNSFLSDPLQLDADQFLSWIILLVVYSCVISWRRNDGHILHHNTEPMNRDEEKIQDDICEIIPKSNRVSSLRQRKESKPKLGKFRDDASTSSRGTRLGSGLSKRLEKILLEEALADDDHNTVDDVCENANHDKSSWAQKAFLFGGLADIRERGKPRSAKPIDSILNRAQTLEWKGFLSVAMLIYRFNGGRLGVAFIAKPTDSYDHGEIMRRVWFNLENVAFSSFLFLTGYNHTSYFFYLNPARISKHKTSMMSTMTDNYGLLRVLGVLFQMNWIAILLSLSLGYGIYEEYVACPLHSFAFLTIWLSMKVWSSINYHKIKFRLKLFFFSCSTFLCDIWLAKGFSHNPTNAWFWQWRYLTHVNYFIPFFGMLFAINQPVASLQLNYIESSSSLGHAIAKGPICIVFTTAIISWASRSLQNDSFSTVHTYFGIIPILAFIYWRNLVFGMRGGHNRFFSSIGQYSLEIYLLSTHATACDRFTVLIPGYPRCNLVFVCIVILGTARLLHNLTKILRELILPERDECKSVQHASSIGVGVFILYIFVKLLRWTDLITVGSISTITIISGMLLYQTVVDTTWTQYRSETLCSANHKSPTRNDVAEPNFTKVGAPLFGVLSIFITCAFWDRWASWTGSTFALAPCLNYVNRGSWVPIKACSVHGNLLQGGVNYFGYDECTNFGLGKEWAWLAETRRCGFRFRDDSDVKRLLLNKRVTFIGDSSVRNLFHSLCRSMGDHDAGGYEGTALDNDLRRLYDTANIEYKWSPLSVDIVSKLKSMRTTGLSERKPRPDLMVLGGGTWDKLHMAATDEDQQSYEDTISKLAMEVKYLREKQVPIVWFNPTSVNSRALNSDEKRSHMSEDSLKDTRQLFLDLGVQSSATFVLDGPSFTNSRVTESFDGITYPNDVYDAGIQILANTFETILEPNQAPITSVVSELPELSVNLYLGTMMLVLAFIGLFFVDGYCGLSYLAQIFVGKENISPLELYQEAFAPFCFNEFHQELEQSGFNDHPK